MIQEGWKTYKLGDIVEIIGGGTPSTSVEEYWNGEIPWLTPKDLTNYKYKFISKGERSITESGLKNSSARLLPKGTVLLTSRAPIGYLALASNPICTNQGFKSLITDETKVNNHFLYYLFRNNVGYIKSLGTGTTFAEVSGSTLKGVEFSMPEDISTQSRIASILSSLDDKIELNLQMNKTLEAIAQAIFKEWFVDFRFPGFDGILVDGLPKGWRKSKVSDTCEVNKNTLSTKDEINEIKYIEISEVERGIIRNVSTYKRGEEPSRAKRKLRHGDIALSTVRPDRGSYFLAYYPENNLIASTGFAVFTATTLPFSFLYCFLTADEQIEYYGRMADGAAYPAINPSIIQNIDLTLPSEIVLKLFNDTAEKLYSKIYENLRENQTLIQIRDLLLPKLMTGKIRVA